MISHQIAIENIFAIWLYFLALTWLLTPDIEAEMAKNRIIELKFQDASRRREELLYGQAKEREEVE